MAFVKLDQSSVESSILRAGVDDASMCRAISGATTDQVLAATLSIVRHAEFSAQPAIMACVMSALITRIEKRAVVAARDEEKARKWAESHGYIKA